MLRLTSRLFAVAVLLFGVALLCGPARADDEDEKKVKAAAEAVRKLATQLDDKDIAAKAKAVRDKNDIEFVMHQMKPRGKGGMGVGVKGPPAYLGEKKDSIELAVIDFATRRKALPAEDIKATQEDLLQLARVTQAIAEINMHNPAPPKPGAKPANWTLYNKEMKAGSQDLTAAIKAGDAEKFKTAAVRLNNSCVNCHMEFRDTP
jgi:hypothetical protein